jgi:hypothetical protein
MTDATVWGFMLGGVLLLTLLFGVGGWLKSLLKGGQR